MGRTADVEDRSEDAFLGGRLNITQPTTGHRAGLDAILLAASCPVDEGQSIADLGAGVGVAGLAVLKRQPGCQLTLVEQDPLLVDLCRGNATNNGFASQTQAIEATIGGKGGAEAAGLQAGSFHHVIANPPFAAPGTGRMSPDARKRAAHQLDESGLEPWFRWAAGLLETGGTFTLIHEPAALGHLLSLSDTRFGGVVVVPIQPRSHEAAHRIILQGVKGSRAALSIAPPLILHDHKGSGYTPQVEDILRNAKPIPISRRNG
ncbi:MAG: methyltransferase [Pseudomonadota bacterium]